MVSFIESGGGGSLSFNTGSEGVNKGNNGGQSSFGFFVFVVSQSVFDFNSQEVSELGESWGGLLEALGVDVFLDLGKVGEEFLVGGLDEFRVVSGGKSFGDDGSDLSEDFEDSTVFGILSFPGGLVGFSGSGGGFEFSFVGVVEVSLGGKVSSVLFEFGFQIVLLVFPFSEAFTKGFELVVDGRDEVIVGFDIGIVAGISLLLVGDEFLFEFLEEGDYSGSGVVLRLEFDLDGLQNGLSKRA